MTEPNNDPVAPSTGDCLRSHEMEALATGRMPPREVGRVLRHISECTPCRELLAGAGLDPSGILSMNRHVADTAVADVAPKKQSDRPTTEDLPVAGLPSASNSGARAKYSFLAPAELPDELGRLGQYRILRVLGEGGMGIVFEAEDPLLNRRVAVKVLRPEGLDDSTRQRFLQEARLAASLHSDRIVTIHQIGEDQGCPYMVMELLHGETLDGRLNREGTLGLNEALRIAREVAEGLAVAHDKGLIHRDIKPANIWLEHGAAPDSGDRVKLLDFGIARPMAAGSNLTQEGRVIGTPNYMCPEQACGMPLDGRSDLFSLGCVLYTMLVGQSPFDRPNTILSIRAVADADVPPLRDKMPKAPKAVVALVKRMLSKNPASRPANARQLVDEIRGLELSLHGTGTPAGSLPSIVRGSATGSSRRLGYGPWIGAAVLVVAALIGGWAQYQRFLTSRDGSGRASRNEQPSQAAIVAAPVAPKPATPVLPPIKVGILHSLTGPMAASERSLVDATIFAIDEINAAGGLLGGRMIEPVIRDGRSYDNIFAEQAVELITKEQVVTLFGVWRSSCRKSVEEACAKYDHLLVYPTSYEGLEESPNIVYMGGAANHQITPAIKYAYAFLGKRKFFLVGTDGMYSRAAHEIIKDEVAALGASIVGNEFRSLANTHFSTLAKQAASSEADIIVNTVVGVGNIDLFNSLREAGIRADQVPILSLNVTEEELRTLASRGEDLAGNFSAWSYFQCLPSEKNREFIARFRKRFGSTRVLTDPMVAAYEGMHLWAKTVEATRSDQVAVLRKAIVEQTFDGPEGLVSIDPKTRNARRAALIGMVDNDYDFEIVWASPRALDPQPYPPTRTREAWDEFVRSVRERYGGQWRPGTTLPPREATQPEK